MFSVVIPLYNKAHTIINTLECVLKQTFTDYEIVIVNDGSTDDSTGVIQRFSSDKRIKLVNQENQGVSGARNTGVANAKFEYVAFLDGDDEWFPEYLQKMAEAIKKFPENEFFCSAGMSKNPKGYGKPRQIDKYQGEIVAFDFFENPHVFLHVSAVVVTKHLFDKIEGFPLGMKRNEDFTFLYKAALISQPIYSGFPLSVYVGGVDGQATATSIYESEKLLEDTISRFNMVYETYEEIEIKDRTFIIFMKYELRHFFLMNILEKQFNTNKYFVKNLKFEIRKHFNFLEMFFLKSSKRYSGFLNFYIKITKVLWRLRGFQTVK